ncbi:MAG: penicillin-binding transpeptidase domain-containing protein [Lawsonella clevelandensis]
MSSSSTSPGCKSSTPPNCATTRATSPAPNSPEFGRQRGQITADGVVLASSHYDEATKKFHRVYGKNADMWSPITGYFSLYSRSGIEYAEDAILSGQDDKLFGDRVIDLFTGRDPRGGNVALTIKPDMQEAAWNALQTGVGAGPLVGGVVAIQPSTGAILALASSPSYDPTPLASFSNTAVNNYDEQLRAMRPSPLINRATAEPLPPGIHLQGRHHRRAAPQRCQRQHLRQQRPPHDPPRHRHPTGKLRRRMYCGGSTFGMAFAYSCNVPFADLSRKLTVRESSTPPNPSA